MQNKKLNKIDDFSFEAFATVTHNHLLYIYICRLYLNLFFLTLYAKTCPLRMLQFTTSLINSNENLINIHA